MSRIARLAFASLLLAALSSLAGVATVAAPVDAAPTAPATQVYIVKPGDYLSAIAVKLKVSLADLLTVNGLTKKSVIHPGDQLIVPAAGVLPSAPPAAPPTSGSRYTVKPGDYFKRIASNLGVSMNDLLAVNGMTKTTVIHAGMQLLVPAGAAVPPVVTAPSSTITTVVNFATAQLGEPYQANGAGPNVWDCSGLTKRAFQAVGVSLPHYSAAQAKYGEAVDWKVDPIRPGDLVFLATAGTISHVGIATGPTTWIHAPGTGQFVRTGNIPLHRVVAVRRLVNGG